MKQLESLSLTTNNDKGELYLTASLKPTLFQKMFKRKPTEIKYVGVYTDIVTQYKWSYSDTLKPVSDSMSMNLDSCVCRLMMSKLQ